MVENFSPTELRDIDEISFTDISSNKKRSKKREFNEYGLVTKLIATYKESERDEDLLAVLTALEGIINTFTIIICPGDATQQIHFNPYMKKFLGMFLTPAEQVNSNNLTYMQAVYRVRWIMRYFSYEDVYSYLVYELIKIIKSMKIITTNGKTCECIYYIQLVMKYKMHTWVLKNAKDVLVDLKEIPSDSSNPEENLDDILDRISFNPENYRYEDNLISRMYDEVDLSILVMEHDIFKCFSHYEKYIIYLHDYLGLENKQIINILKFETLDELVDRLEDIRYKLNLINEEEN